MMNNRIKALIEKAREEVKSRQKFGSDTLHRYIFSADDFHQRIAELIVKECATIASKVENNDNEFRCVYDVIVEHFGVEP